MLEPGERLGVLNLYKEKGYTSHDCVAICKRLFNTAAGHAGTLDPGAEGVLPICLGRATRLCDYIATGTKDYAATVKFGAATDTQDSSGNIVSERPVTAALAEAKAALAGFIGKVTQTPPMYSAVKIGGKKLYELARQGKEVEREPREVTFYSLETDWEGYPDYINLSVTCSKGAYIRTLCYDLGRALGGAAHMGSLIRTRVGRFSAGGAARIGELKEAGGEAAWRFAVKPQDALADFGIAECGGNIVKTVNNGGKIALRDARISREYSGEGEPLYFITDGGRLCGLYRLDGGVLAPKAVFPEG